MKFLAPLLLLLGTGYGFVSIDLDDNFNFVGDCSADIVILMDNSGSIERDEFMNARTLVKKFINSLDFTRFRTALVTYRRNAKTVWNFTSPEATNAAAAIAAVDAIPRPTRGGTHLTAALEAAGNIFEVPQMFDCKVTIVFSDGASGDRNLHVEAVADFAEDVRSKICYVEMEDPDESFKQMVNRDNEIRNILANSDYFSMLLRNQNFEAQFNDAQGVATVEWLNRCTCLPCFNQ